MGAIGYLYRRILVNRIKMALRRPITWLYIVIILFYMFILPFSLRAMAEQFALNSPSGMAAAITVFAFWIIPGNLIAFSRRKGIIYRNSDVHFMFPSPITPKQVLIYSYLKTLVAGVLMTLFAVCCGGIVFQVPGWKLFLYFLFSAVVENVLEGGLMMLLYGSEELDEKKRGMVVKGAYCLLGILILLAVRVYLLEGLSFGSVMHFLHSDLVQMVPLIGWYIGVIHLLFTGPTVVNVMVTILYLSMVLAVVLAAYFMRCTGGYYEDALKFAEDYEEVVSSRRQGNMEKRLGKKQKFNSASVNWKGGGAKALFYRQLLEYKKSKYFIFDINTVISLIAGGAVAYAYIHEGGFGESIFASFAVPMMMAYLIFIFTSMNGKWAKELKSPYTYMLPDSPFRKLMYATAMQHVQNLVNGLLIAVPAAVVMKMSPVTAVLSIVFYVALAANKLYALAVAEAVLGGSLGTVGKNMFQLFIQSFVILIAFVGALTGNMVGGVTLAYLLMDVFLILATVIFMVLAAFNFYKMETA